MGIKSLLKFLRDRNSEIVQTFDLALLKGYRIAIDIAVLAYQMKSQYISKVAYKLDLVNEEIDYHAASNYMMRHILRTLDAILVAGCVPVVVFDGKPPELKAGTKKDRTAKANKKKNNIAELKRLCRGLLGKEPFSLTESDLAFLRTFKKPIRTIDDMKKRLETEVRAYISITPQDYVQLSAIFSSIGLPYIHAESEAEQTCSQMARHRDVIAIFTTDSDCLVYGCPIMINKISVGQSARIQSSPKVECYTFNNVLSTMNMTNSQFIDFCIGCGTDFNKNPSGYGPEKIYELITTYGSITKIDAAQCAMRSQIEIQMLPNPTKADKLLLGFNIATLNYDAVRCFFTRPVNYDRNALKIRVDDNQFERAFDSLNTLLGAENFIQIMDVCKKIVERLHAAAKIMKH